MVVLLIQLIADQFSLLPPVAIAVFRLNVETAL